MKGLAPLAAKTDEIDARVLAELVRRDLVPEIWLPTPDVRAELPHRGCQSAPAGTWPESATGPPSTIDL